MTPAELAQAIKRLLKVPEITPVAKAAERAVTKANQEFAVARVPISASSFVSGNKVSIRFKQYGPLTKRLPVAPESIVRKYLDQELPKAAKEFKDTIERLAR